MADYYATSREKISEKLHAASEYYNYHTEQLEYTLEWVSWSNLASDVAIQAALQAAMMGVASAACKAIATSNRLAAQAQVANSFKFLAPMIKGAYQVKTVVSQIAFRVALGCSAVIVKKAFYKFANDEDFFDMSLLKGLALATICGTMANAPANKGASLTGVDAPQIKSLKTLVQALGVFGAVNHWKSNPANRKLLEWLRNHRHRLHTHANQVAADIAAECVAWGIEMEPKFVSEAENKVSKLDFSSQVNFITRVVDWRSDAKVVEILKYQSVKCAGADARLSLWLAINQALREIEQERLALTEELSVLG